MDEFRELSAVFIGVVVVMAVMTMAVLIPVRQLVHHSDVSVCRQFAEQSGYQTKFVDYNIGTWDCLGKTSDGRWIPTDRLHDVNVER